MVKAHINRRRETISERTSRTVPGLAGSGREWRTFLQDGIDETAAGRIEEHASTGRPLGSEEFVVSLEERTGRRLRRRRPGWPEGRRRRG